MRKTISILLVFVLLLTTMSSVSASEWNQPTPRYAYISSFARSININPSTRVATCQGDVVASSYLPVKVVCKLQVYWGGEWTTLKTWTKEGTGGVMIYETYTVAYDFNYRVYVTGYVYDNDGNQLEVTSGTHEQYLPSP